ncbi:MAG: PhzF family phenazine biosynthesis protein [Acidobacteriota bacterium]|nr:PhzF family phenazine biosynthesis protein [Acidobacteriota bacterium]
MPLPITQVDAFTSKPFKGNPAAVCLLPRPTDASWMQRVAREMNLSETAFLVRRDDGGFDLRWFTPAVEVDLCGHATLASAHVLWEENHLAPDTPAVFHTRSGRLSAVLRGGWIEMDFPAEPDEPAAIPDGLADALGTEPTYVGRNRFDYLVQVDAEATVRRLAPDFRRLREIDARGVIVTARAETDGFDFVSRYFAPHAGIDEDPVTGSTHCCLGPYWQRRLGRNTFTAWQASERGGLVRVRVHDERVALSGQAVTVLRGELLAGHEA